MPVLTQSSHGAGNARAAATGNKTSPWTLTAKDKLELTLNGVALSLAAPDKVGATSADVIKWLNEDAGFAKAAVASDVVSAANKTDFVRITSKVQGDDSKVEVLDSAVATLLGLKVGETLATPGSYSYVDLRFHTDPLNDDVRIKRTAGAAGYYEYVLDDVKGLADGTYTYFVQLRAGSSGNLGIVKGNFQIGTETAEPYPAFGCNDCHALEGKQGTFHGDYPIDPDVCKNCHDYKRQRTGYSKWTSSNNGYGAAPYSRRIHGVHFGAYTDKPLEIHSSWGVHFSTLVFPQDVRNCTKCHKTNSWAEKPGRVPCLGCHDTDKAINHAALQTWDATPEEPYSGDEVETCDVCHGAGRDFAADVVHNITSPYKAPYPRGGDH